MVKRERLSIQLTLWFQVGKTRQVSLFCSPNPAPAGSAVTCSATVSGSNPTGTIIWNTSSTTGSFSSIQTNLVSGTSSTTYTDTSQGTATITASYGGDENNAQSTGNTTLTLTPERLDSFAISTIGSQIAGGAFAVTITAKDANGNPFTSYTGSVSLTDLSGSISPENTGMFTDGAWTGQETVTKVDANDVITVTDSASSITGQSNAFTVTPDFKLEVSPSTLSAPITGIASVSVQILPLTGYVGSYVVVAISSLPDCLEALNPGPILVPVSSSSSQAVNLDFYVNSLAQIDQSYSFNIIANGIVSREVTILITKTDGVQNSIYFSSVNQGWDPLLPASFSIQQNFFLTVPSSSGIDGKYWVQNVIDVKQNALGDYSAACSFQIWDYINGGGNWLPFAGNPWPWGLSGPLLAFDHPVSFPTGFSFTCSLTGNQLSLSNTLASWSWTIPTQNIANEQEPDNAYILNYPDGQNSLAKQCPEFVVVGGTNSGTADFYHTTTGNIQPTAELGQTWTSSTSTAAAQSGSTMSGEKSSGLTWSISSNTDSFSDSSSGSDAGVFFAPQSISCLIGGTAGETQGPISASISDPSATDGTPVTITMIPLDILPLGIEINSPYPTFYDVNVQGISGGTATVSITNSGVTSLTSMEYLVGGQWVYASDVTISGNTVTGEIPVSDLGGTPIALTPVNEITVSNILLPNPMVQSGF